MSDADAQHRYQVFISYSHKDKEWAEWLEQKLEAYRVPRGLDGRSRIFEVLPKRIKPVFRDRSTAAAGTALSDDLRNWLDSSANLIVICSPNSAHPNPTTGRNLINEEIEHFHATDRGDRVFSIIVDGEPFANDDTEAFPPAFLKTPPLAADAREQGDGRELAFMKLAAGILGVELIDLQDKQNLEEKRRSQLAQRVALGFAGLAVVAVLGLFMSALNHWSALNNRSNTLATFARIEADAGQHATALQLSLAGLNTGNGLVRPSPLPAQRQLQRALHYQDQRGVYKGHSARVQHAAFSSDGRFVATSAIDDSTHIWDASTGTLIHQLRPGGDGFGRHTLNQAIFSPDGSHLVTVDTQGPSQLWDMATGEPIARYGERYGNNEGDLTAAFSPDGSTLALLPADGPPQIISIESPDNVQQIGTSYRNSGTVAEFSPNGSYLAIATLLDGISIWNTQTWSLERQLEPQARGGGLLKDFEISTDGQTILAAYSSGTVILWNVASGEAELVHETESSAPNALSWSPDGSQFLIKPGGPDAQVYRLEDGEQLFTLEGSQSDIYQMYDDTVWSAEYSSDGRFILTASNHEDIRLWDATTGALLNILRGHSGVVSSASFSPDSSRVVSTSYDGTARIWDTEVNQPLYTIPASGAVFSPDDQHIIARGTSDQTTLWSAETGELIGEIAGAIASPLADGQSILTGTRDGVISFWSTEDASLLGSFQPYGVRHATLEASQSGPQALMGPEVGPFALFNVETAKPIKIFSSTEDQIVDVRFVANGKLVLADGYYTTVEEFEGETYDIEAIAVRFFNSEDGSLVSQIETGHPYGEFGYGESGYSGAMAVSPDGKTLLFGTESIKAWNIEDGSFLYEIPAGEIPIGGFPFTSDGTRFLTLPGDRTVRIWNAETGDEEVVLRGHAAALESAVFSADGTLIATSTGIPGVDAEGRGSPYPSVSVWDAKSGERLLEIWQLDIAGIDFSNDGLLLAISSNEQTQVWDLSLLGRTGAELISLGCRNLPFGETEITPELAQRYLGNSDHSDRRLCNRTGWLPFQ